jgi:hypothetical protein
MKTLSRRFKERSHRSRISMSCSGENAAIAATRTHVSDGDASSATAGRQIGRPAAQQPLLMDRQRIKRHRFCKLPTVPHRSALSRRTRFQRPFDLRRRLVCQSLPRRLKRRDLLL